MAGGVETAPHEYPSAAYLEDSDAGRLLCGAVLLSPRYGLTAAHCAEQVVDKKSVNLVVGDHDRSQREWTRRGGRRGGRVGGRGRTEAGR